MRRYLPLVLAIVLTLGCSDEPRQEGNDAGLNQTDPDADPNHTEPDADPNHTEPDADPNHTEPTPGDWRLPEDYFVPAKMEMTLVHPRNHEASSWAYARNAHPGVTWEIPVVVQGGAWPFQYEIVDDGGADGLVIGGELHRREDGDYLIHEVTDDYGVLRWDDPVEGAYEILLRVNDQDENSLDVPISLTVGTEGWIFVDPATGDDGNDGSIDAPFATVGRIHDGDGAPFGGYRVYLVGEVLLDGNRENGNLRIDEGDAPAVWVGFPGSDAVLEAFEGKFVLDSPDFYLANLEHRHHEDFFQDDDTFLHMITVWQNTHRYTVHDVTFSRFQGVPVNTGLGNSSLMMFTNPDVPRNHVAVVNNTMTGTSGFMTSAYFLHHAVFEKNRAVDAHFTTGEASVWAIIYIKGGDNQHVTLRANRFVGDNQWDLGSGALGILQARNVEVAYNTVETPWDSGRRGTLVMWTNSSQSSYTWTEDTPVWVYRNSLRRRLHWEGDNLANMPDGNVHIERNLLEGGAWPESPLITADDNHGEGTYFDVTMSLTDDARPDHLGRRGAEIAVPLDEM